MEPERINVPIRPPHGGEPHSASHRVRAWSVANALALALVGAALLTGCAAQRTYQEGQSLIAQGKAEEGLAKIEQASHLDPESAEYRLSLLNGREHYAMLLCDQADAARKAAQWDAAARLYRQALAQSAQQDRAIAGLRATDRERRWTATVAEARAAVDRKDLEAARAKLRGVLMEGPGWSPAVQLLGEIELATRADTGPVELNAAYKQLISLDFKDAPLKTIFNVISRSSGLNILFDKDVKTDQRTSIYLRNSSIEAAMNWLLLTNQLEQRALDGNTVLVYPSTASKQQQYQPLQVKSFYLANADAKTVANSLHTLLKSKNVVVDEKLNLIILKDSPDAIRLAEKVIALHDVPDAEVMLEVEVLEVTRERLLDLGITWPNQVGLTLLPTPTGTSSGTTAGTTGNTLTLADLKHPHSNNVGVSVGNATINVKKQDNDAHILANPRIRVRNHEKAKIMIGEKVPNVSSTLVPTGVVSESVAYLDVGLKLDAEPSIYLDNEVSIKLGLEVSSITNTSVTKNGTTTYQIGSRNAQTVLRLRDGENQILAGLINAQEQGSANKIPGLGDLPLIGRLFGSQSTDNTRTEIVLSITPHIVRNVQRPSADLLEFDAGTEDSLKTWPKNMIRTGALAKAVPAAAAPDASSGSGASEAASANSESEAPPANVMTQSFEKPATAGANGAPLPPQRPVQLHWSAPSEATPGDTVAAQLWISSKNPLMKVPLVAEFDPRVVEVVSVSEGVFLKAGGTPTAFQPRIEASGQVTLITSRTAPSTANEPGVLANFVFRIKPGTKAQKTQVQLLPISATDASGQMAAADPPMPLELKLVPAGK